MTNLYADFAEINYLAKVIAEEGVSPEKPSTSIVVLRCHLMSLDDRLMDGQRYISDRIPSVMGIWFQGYAAKLQNSLSEQEGITDDTLVILNQLHRDMSALMEPLTGPEGMNLDPNLTIREFSEHIFTFYRGLPREAE